MFQKKILRFLFILVCFGFVQIIFAQQVTVINQKGTKIDVNNNTVITAATPPVSPLIADIWFDSATNISKVYDGAVWKEIDTDAVTTSNTSPTLPVTGDIWFDNTDLNNIVMNVWNGLTWVNSANDIWLTTGNSGTTSANFLGTIDDVRMQIRSNNTPLLEFGRRQTLGLTQGYPDYTDDNQPLVYVNGNSTVSALQFAASGAQFYKPMFFTTANGSFRLKGSTGGTDLFEIGSAGDANNGRLEFIIGDDGAEPIVFKRYNYYDTTHKELFRVQGSSNASDAKPRFGININPIGVAVDATYNNNPAQNIANSTFQVNGSVSNSIITTSGNLTLTEDHHTVILGGNHIISLPIASTCTGRIYIIKNKNAVATTISSYINEQGISATSIASSSILWVQSNGANWEQIALVKATEIDGSVTNEINTAFASAINTLTITDSNGSLTAPIVNSNDLSITSGQIVSTVNGVASTAVSLPVANGAETKVNVAGINTISGSGTTASPYLITGTEVDGSITNEIQTLSQTGTIVTLSNGGGTISVADNDDSSNNEIQNISTNGSAGNITLSSGATLNLNVNDADSSTANELQTLSQSTGASATGDVTLSNSGGTVKVVSANANNQIKVGTDGGAYLGPTVYTGYFIVDYSPGTNIISVSGIPFQPSQVTFVAHANVDSIRSNGDNASNNSNTLINSFGTMNGFANNSTGTLVQQVIYVGGSGNSINDIGWFSDDRRCIGVRYGNQNGDNLGVIEGTLSAFTTVGFNIDIDYNTVGNPTLLRNEKLVVLYTAYK